jgi:fluoride ion exporter CrcB/FEX
VTWIASAAGGALGALTRHGVNHVIHQRALGSTFPAGIFVINVAGSFAIGLIAGALAADRLRHMAAAAANAVGQVTLSLLGVWAGWWLTAGK